jgi:hypothetical protein
MTTNCSVPGCTRGVHVRGMCNAHYIRARRTGSPLGLQVMRDAVPALCTVPGCQRQHSAKGLCKTHYERQRTKGSLDAKPKRPAGEGTVASGYCVFVKHIGGKKVRIRRCRLVMEQKLGRKLRPEETVHHRNGIKTDDRPSNLELWSTVHPKGQRVSDLLKFARSIIRLYS